VKKLLFLALLLPALALAIYDTKSFDLNRWNVLFGNDGRWAYDVGPSSLSGVPANYIFGAGAWLGGIIGTDTLVTFMYNPNTGGTEMGPTSARYWRGGYDNPDDRIYKYPGDWPPPLSRFPEAPQQNLSEMDLWYCCTDSDPAFQSDMNRPIGIDVLGTVCGFADSNAWDFFFIRYEIVNMSPDTVHDVYFGPVADADIGDANDDMTGLILDGTYVVRGETIRVRNTGFVYDGDNYELSSYQWDSSGAPGTVAIMLLQAPQDLGLTAFKRFTIDIDPNTDPDRYLTMAGYDYRTRVPAPYDSTSWEPADQRVLFSSGPLNLAPGSTATYWYAVIGSPFGEVGQWPTERDTSELALRCKWARYYFGLLTGVAEEMPKAEVRTTNAATIVRGVLLLPGASSHKPQAASWLLDISGRKVLGLKPGPNEVSLLSPGVYFVRDARAQAQATRKVVLTR
jgi:hypothetical protein